ncbi:hypothetical protein LEP1GSC038_2587 [Leptospira weilii str. 2006001855]|uniref:Uncharacterized protein n=1 Tax=Leptospira weilii str. 2006001855 TaxID=996804 RepID=M6G390_9LEPT|nr:hypothetical protein LEP1GSC038_2587 [Leptospira weilii str. 2006001855]
MKNGRFQVPIWRQNTLIFRSARKFLSFLRSESDFQDVYSYRSTSRFAH